MKLTETQALAMRRLSVGLSPWTGIRARTGGAIHRMLDRLNAADLIEPRHPWKLTPLGLLALNYYDDAKANRKSYTAQAREDAANKKFMAGTQWTQRQIDAMDGPLCGKCGDRHRPNRCPAND